MAKEELKAAASEEINEEKLSADLLSVMGSETIVKMFSILNRVLPEAEDTNFMTHPEMQNIIKIKQFAFAIVKEARDRSIPPSVINQYIFDFIQEEVALEHYKKVADFMRNAKIGTEKDQEFFTKLAEEHAVKQKEIAQQEQLREKPPRDYFLLDSDATMADLLADCDSEETVIDMYQRLLAYLFDNDYGRALQLMKLQQNPEQAKTMKVFDFFGDDPSDLIDIHIITWEKTEHSE